MYMPVLWPKRKQPFFLCHSRLSFEYTTHVKFEATISRVSYGRRRLAVFSPRYRSLLTGATPYRLYKHTQEEIIAKTAEFHVRKLIL